MRSLHILSPVAPFPPLSGGTAHIMRTTRQLARFYRLHFAALANDPAQVTWGPLAELCASTHALRRGPARGRFFDPPAVRQEYSAELHTYMNGGWAGDRPEIVQLEFTSMAQYARLACAAGALVVCVAHNVGFLAQIRRARLERERRLRARRWLGALSLWLYELRALPHCHLVITLSDADKAALQRWLPHLPTEYVHSAIDLDEWPVCFSADASNEVLFVGNYLHPPNVEGALWLAREVWPLVRQAQPNARLTLAGRDPTPAIRALAAPDIRVPGAVDDLRALYARAALVAAPIFWGSGVRIKLLEALACGMPVVSTALAAEGIDLRHDQSALFAEQADTFAAAIHRLLNDQQLRSRLGVAGRAIAERDYSAKRIGEQLAALYERQIELKPAALR